MYFALRENHLSQQQIIFKSVHCDFLAFGGIKEPFEKDMEPRLPAKCTCTHTHTHKHNSALRVPY